MSEYAFIPCPPGTGLYFIPAQHKVSLGLFRAELERGLDDRDGKGCFYCGANQWGCVIDHVRAKSRGGSDSINNLVWACGLCNLLKGDTPAWFFVLWLEAGRPSMAALRRSRPVLSRLCCGEGEAR